MSFAAQPDKIRLDNRQARPLIAMNRLIPRVLSEYVAGLASHDIGRIAATVSDDLLFISATRVLAKQQFLDMLNALYTGFPDWHYAYDEFACSFRVEDAMLVLSDAHPD